MKYFAITLMLSIFAISSVLAQSTDYNYVVQQTMLDDSSQNFVTTTEFYDGLGRKSQTIVNGVKPGSSVQALLSRTAYDLNGREYQQFLSVPTSGQNYQSAVSYRDNDLKSLSTTTYDALDRPLFVTTPGSDMGAHGKKYGYGSNSSNSVKYYLVSTDGTLTQQGYYPSGTLTMNRITDENNSTTEVYTDLFSHKVLERHILYGNTSADTYFVYNSLGYLCFVLQPMYQNEASLDKYAFRYVYNDYGLIAEKIIPGCEKITYTYDKGNRLLTMQDGEMRAKGLKMYYSYDSLSRLKNKTLYSGEAIINEEQTNYYGDDYSFINSNSMLNSDVKSMLNYSETMGSVEKNNYKLQSGTVVHASDGTDIITAFYYDAKDRVVEKNSKLLGRHLRREQFTYTFTNQLVKHITIDYIGTKEVFRSIIANNYDATTGLLISVDLTTSVHGVTSPKRRIASYDYDDYGRIKTTTHGSVVQTTDYDVRDWPKKLSSSNFTEDLVYTGRYHNGNINSLHYRGPYYDYTYEFVYDNLDRLIDAEYYNHWMPEEDWAEANFSESAQYDANGNITQLLRTGFPDEGEESTLIDALELSYEGNQLTSVIDNENDLTYMTTKNFMQNSHSPTHYTYNANGAVVTDANKGVVYTEYDLYGYPKHIYFNNGGIITYVHTPDGKKLQTTYTTAVSNVRKPYGEPFTLTSSQVQSVVKKEYWGEDVVCKNGVPDMYLFEGGYADIRNDALTYHYYVKDHLGNHRIVQNEKGKVEASYNYYPFGNTFDHFGELYASSIIQPYRYNGKEYDSMYGLEMYDYGARLYDPLVGRWFSIDPLSEKYYSISPYVYCADNPVKHVDPDGRWVANVVAGCVGAAVELASQKLTDSNRDINWTRVGISALESGLTCGASLGKQLTVHFVAASANSFASGNYGNRFFISTFQNMVQTANGMLAGEATKIVTKSIPLLVKSLSHVTSNKAMLAFTKKLFPKLSLVEQKKVAKIFQDFQKAGKAECRKAHITVAEWLGERITELIQGEKSKISKNNSSIKYH
ncbi:RHS repeat domain-containing protein [Segatella bryantii]|uniref:RHS repeat domain-containing protein n=1 Tax=Segatella bryantii TaxID=77095 RepID=UPI00242F8A80|nr:RHS repeat-associated core domain-containing protein [Segatella bryantii]